MPRVRALAKSATGTFFTTPRRVAMNTNCGPSKPWRFTMVVISSSPPMDSSTLMLCPLACRLLSGISCTFTQ